MKRTLCMESLPIDSFPLFRPWCCWNRLSALAQTQVTSDSHTGSHSSLSGRAGFRELGTSGFFHSVYQQFSCRWNDLGSAAHKNLSLLFANTVLHTPRCVISKDFSLGRLCKWSVNGESSDNLGDVQNQCPVKANKTFKNAIKLTTFLFNLSI